VVGHADFLNLVDWFGISEANYVRTYRKLVSILYLDSLFRNVHPGAILAGEIKHIEVFKPIEFELSVL
jgi:hypothetical protein